MRARNLYIMYIMIGIIGAITTQALPVIYKGYGYDSSQIYNLISVVFLATIFQPIIGFVIDKYFTQKQGINILFILTGVISFILVFITSYSLMLIFILFLSIFRIPIFAIVDGYVSTLSHKFNLNMGLIRSGTMMGYGFGIIILILFLLLFNLTSNYTFLLVGIISAISVVIINFTKEGEETSNNVQNSIDQGTTKWDIYLLLLLVQIVFFGFSILKINYTTPLLMEYAYSNVMIAITAVVGVLPLIILIPLFGKIFKKFKYTTIMLFCVFINILQTTLFILFPDKIFIILIGSFLTGFIFPLYSPVFSLFLRETLNSKFVSTGFTIAFTLQNVFVFVFNQFVIINILTINGTVISAFSIILMFFILSLIPLVILRVKKY